MLKEKLGEIIESAYQVSLAEGELALPCPTFAVWRAGRQQYGDFSSNLPLKLGTAGKDSITIAQRLSRYISLVDEGSDVVCAVAGPGFLNFRLSNRLLCRTACELVRLAKSNKLADTAKPELLSGEARFRLEVAYGRCNAILRLVREAQADIVSGSQVPPLVNDSLWQQWLSDLEEASTYEPLFESGAYASAKELIISLDSAGDIEALDRILLDFLNESPFFQLDLSVGKARLGLIFACRHVLCGWLGIIG